MAKIVVGIDEVGRGPWAGPVVSSAVVMAEGQQVNGVNDSKQLSKQKRESVIESIKQVALNIGIGWVSSAEIDEFSLSASVKLSMHRAMEQINCNYDEI